MSTVDGLKTSLNTINERSKETLNGGLRQVKSQKSLHSGATLSGKKSLAPQRSKVFLPPMPKRAPS